MGPFKSGDIVQIRDTAFAQSEGLAGCVMRVRAVYGDWVKASILRSKKPYTVLLPSRHFEHDWGSPVRSDV